MSTNVQQHSRPTVDRLLGITDTASTLGLSAGTVRRYVREGRLRPVRLVPNGRLRFRERDVQQLIDEGSAETS